MIVQRLSKMHRTVPYHMLLGHHPPLHQPSLQLPHPQPELLLLFLLTTARPTLARMVQHVNQLLVLSLVIARSTLLVEHVPLTMVSLICTYSCVLLFILISSSMMVYKLSNCASYHLVHSRLPNRVAFCNIEQNERCFGYLSFQLFA